MKLAYVSLRNVLNGAYILANQQAYYERQFKSRDELHHIQTKKLRRILKLAVDEVPFYKGLKKEINFERFSFAELEKFPIIDKATIRKQYDDFITNSHRGKPLEYKTTSGSSGEPFKVPKAYYSDAIEQCLMFRAWSMNPEYRYRFHHPCIVLRSFSPKPGAPPFKVDKIMNYWYLSPFDITDQNIQLYYDIIRKSGAKLLRGYPSSIYIFTLMLEKHNLQLPSIKTLFTSSENLLPGYKRKIEEYWKIPLIDWYGQNERTATVQMCEHGVYHNNDEYGHIELDANNQIIATSLTNDVMPLIRYATSDIATPAATQTCSCGRGLSIPFSGIDGRADDLLIKQDGTIIATVNIYNAMEQFAEVRQFRIIQEANRAITLQLVPGQGFDDAVVRAVENEIHQRLGEVDIHTEILDGIERDRNTGKIKAIVSKVKF